MTFSIDYTNFPIGIKPPENMIRAVTPVSHGPMLSTPLGEMTAHELVKQISKNLDETLSNLKFTAVDRECVDNSVRSFFDNWIKQAQPVPVESYSTPIFDAYGFLHFSPKRPGDPKMRYGVQAILRGNLFESRKNFRSRRKAREWVRQQLTCRMWPAVPSIDNMGDPFTMSVTFDYSGPLDSNYLSKVYHDS